MNLYLGIDGGGTSTRAVLVNERGEILGQGKAGPSNIHNVGTKASGSALLEATQAAFAAAGIPRRAAVWAFLGTAAIKAPQDAEAMEEVARPLALAENVRVVTDAENVLAGGLLGRPGIVLISGTGSVAYGRNARRETAACGGWGYFLGDEGSGVDLGKRAVQAVARAADGLGPETAFTRTILADLGLDNPHRISHRIYIKGFSPQEFASLAPRVIEAARQNDEVARRIVQEAVEALTGLVRNLAQRLFADEPVEIVLSGGIARSGPVLQPLLEAHILRSVPGSRIVEPALEPVLGAALNALQAAGIDLVAARASLQRSALAS